VGKLEELEKLDRTIKDCDIKARTIKLNIDTLSEEIEIMYELESQLGQNLKCLKKKGIIAIASEYVRSKEALAKTRVRSIALRNDREQLKKTVDQLEKIAKKAREDMEKLNKIGDNNVLCPKFGRKNGQK
jgi:DNA repair exonuclease SbcCD ATPase subunit